VLEHLDLPIKGVRVETITVERCRPDYNDLGWQTFSLLTEGLDLENPGKDAEIARYFRMLMSNGRLFLPGTMYANPSGVVRSPKADSRFFRIARQIQNEWYGQFNDGLASANRVRRAMGAVSPLIRQLIHTGVLFIDSRHIFPDRWPDKVPTNNQDTRIGPGERFGKLIVLEVMPAGQVRCLCTCGAESIKKRKHLVSNQTKSCGCSTANRQERERKRRKNRGWKKTGFSALK
jgi:hypothetical protein